MKQKMSSISESYYKIVNINISYIGDTNIIWRVAQKSNVLMMFEKLGYWLAIYSPGRSSGIRTNGKVDICVLNKTKHGIPSNSSVHEDHVFSKLAKSVTERLK